MSEPKAEALKLVFSKLYWIVWCVILLTWCAERDLNPHALRHYPLKIACLPIPPPAQEFVTEEYQHFCFLLPPPEQLVAAEPQ